MLDATQSFSQVRAPTQPPPRVPVHRYVSAALVLLFVIGVLAALLLRRRRATL
jgi:hypothetical protein